MADEENENPVPEERFTAAPEEGHPQICLIHPNSVNRIYAI